MLNPSVSLQLYHQFDITKAISLRRQNVSKVLRERNEERAGNWKRRFWQLEIVLAIGVSSAILGRSDRALAQITPDSNLGTESSRVTPNVVIKGLPSDQIDGGAIRGANLFHSFQQFNIGEGRGAYFTNPAGIENILSRVTGSSRSDILGRLGVLGSSNLFLINPNGIIFGQNASLDVGGSFVGTTANAIGFGNQGFFSASAPNVPSPLLTANPSAFLFNQITAAPIENRSTASAGLDPSGSFKTFGLRVPDGRSLLLVGGNIRINSGGIVAFGGRVDLGGVVGEGAVGLDVDANNLRLNFSDTVPRADVSLTNGAGVIVASSGGGDIAIHARNIDVSGGSSVQAGIGRNLGSVSSQAGDITLNATGTISVTQSGGQASYIENGIFPGGTGNSGDMNVQAQQLIIKGEPEFGFAGLFVGIEPNATGTGGNLTIHAGQVTVSGGNALTYTFGHGNSGNLRIETGRLSIRDGGWVRAITSGVGDAGNVTVLASDSVEVIGTSPANPQTLSRLSSVVYSGAQGNAGNLTVETRRLSIRDGAEVESTTFGVGNAGNLTVRATDSVVLSGEIPGQGGRLGFPGGLFAQVDLNGTGHGGNLTIETRHLSVSDGSKVQVATFGQGDAGDLLIRASEVDVFETPRYNYFSTGIFAGVGRDPRNVTPARGNGGNLTIETGRLSIYGGQVSSDTRGDGNAGRLFIQARDLVEVVDTSAETGWGSYLRADVIEGARGRGGNLAIETGQLIVRDGAQVTVSSQGAGKAGDLQVTARSIELDNQGKLIAETALGQGGNITLNIQDLLLLRHNSEISTNAGTAHKGGDGGNITINSPFIVAVPKEDSDITANAYTGRGGNINITTQGIYGLQFRPRRTPLSDITASSDFGVNGTVQINSAFDVTQSVTNLPIELVDASNQIDQTCSPSGAATREGNRFVVTGRGGLPPSPNEPLQGESVVTHWVTLDPQAENQDGEATSAKLDSSAPVASGTPTKPTLVEAQGWMYGANGEVILTASASTIPLYSSPVIPDVCRGR